VCLSLSLSLSRNLKDLGEEIAHIICCAGNPPSEDDETETPVSPSRARVHMYACMYVFMYVWVDSFFEEERG